jgi:P pilus assembly chaperone PapD
MLKTVSLCVSTILLSLFSPLIFAKASLYLTEDVLFLSDKRSITSVNIINRGTRTGVFEVRWLDHEMQESGALKRLKTGQALHSLAPKVRYSPRRVTLQPGKSQRIKVALKRKAKQSPAGEYYSHLNVLTINDDLESTIEQQPEKDEPAGLHVKARIGISIPVIWRHQVTAARASLSVAWAEGSKAKLRIEKEGKASLRGYIHVINQKSGQAAKPVMPVVLYPNLNNRFIELVVPDNNQEDLLVIYSASAKAEEAKDNALAQVNL